jgi:hypothetical protein
LNFCNINNLNNIYSLINSSSNQLADVSALHNFKGLLFNFDCFLLNTSELESGPDNTGTFEKEALSDGIM